MTLTIVDDARPVTGGVDTHADTHVAAALDGIGGLLGVQEFAATPAGYARLLGWLQGFGAVGLVGIEGTGSYGAGLARHVAAAGIRVVEVDRSDRQDRRRKGKSDPLDAVSAARAALSGRAAGAPRGRDGQVEAVRALMVAKRTARAQRTQTINQARALIITGPDGIRPRFTGQTPAGLVAELATLRPRPGSMVRYHTLLTLRELGRRAQFLDSQLARLDELITPLVTARAPGLLSLFGVGPDTAAMLLTIGGLDRAEPGDLMSRVTSDTTLLRDVTTNSVVGVVTGSLTLVATLVLMGLMDVVLLGVTMGVFSLTALVIGVVVPRIGRAARQAQDSVGGMGAALERVLGAFRTVKSSGAEAREGERIHTAARDAWRAHVRAVKWQAIAGNTAGLSIQCAFLAILAVGGARVTSGAISVGTLVAFLLYIFYLMMPIQLLEEAASQYQVAAAAVARIQEAERLPVEAADPPAGLVRRGPAAAWPTGPSSPGHGAEAVPVPPASVAFEQVRFRYRPELPEVHHGVSFVIPPRGMTAFVGPSGAGKTTVFSLIERFYEPQAGRVLVDGADVRDWPLNQLRAAIGYVEQDAPVLSGSLRENLLLGAPDATEAQIAEMLRITRLRGLVARLPDGLETAVGHRGTRLSGGERQRVAIGRALLRRPRLLLLDEATSQLDALNEAALRETVTETAVMTTVLVVAHRLSTVTMADRLIVMDAGQVKAVGTHGELVAGDPLYAELAATQFLGSVEA